MAFMKKGQKHTEVTKRKMSLSHKGRGHTSESIAKIKRTKKKNPYRHTTEARKKMSEGRKGIKLSEQHKKSISESLKGKKWSEESLKKLRSSLKGKIKSEEHRKHISEANYRIRDKISARMKGENHPNWQGGVSRQIYGEDWTITLRRSIRERDGYRCQVCGFAQGDRAFPVHHIDYNKKNCDPDNLITLCYSCHTKTNKNRVKWQEYFKVKHTIC